MAIPIERVHLKMAHAALPGLLRTPPRKYVAPLLPAPWCAAILPGPPLPKPSRASSCGRWDSNKKSVASSLSLAGRTSSGSRADSDERWDAHKKPVSPAASPPPSSASSNKWRPKSHASKNSMELWDAHKEQRVDEHDDDGKSSTASNDMEVDMQLPPLPPPVFFAGPGFIASPEPSMLPMPSSFMIRAA